MGKKGNKMTTTASTAAEALRDRLAPLGDIRLRKMFGGYGVFEETKMFALIDGAGEVFFKADASNLPAFEEAGAAKHARMPYYRVPDAVYEDEKELHTWAKTSIEVAKAK